MIFEISCPIPVFKNFDYLPPDGFPALDPKEILGRRVRISFGRKDMVGIVSAVKETSEFPLEKLKPVAELLDEEPLLSPELVDLGRWLAGRYVCSLGEALFAMLPPGRGNPQSYSEPEPEVVYRDEYIARLGPSPILTKDQETAARIIHETVYRRPGDGGKPPSERLNIEGRSEGGFPPSTFLLLGAAATGKTEVYMEAIKDVLAQGRTALYLVPEISLALQLYEVLKNRFGEKNVLHWRSDLGQKKRIEDWRRIRRGEFSVVIGSRTTVLAPLPNLGAIVVDEEHDSAYKEDRKPRFNARDVAVERGKRSGAVVIFGSATPSLEIMKDSLDGKIQLIELLERAIPAAEPKIKLVDLLTERPRKSISPTLETAINERSKAGEQTILFLNRRGFFRYAMCPKCDWTAKCPNCSIGLIFHSVETGGGGSVPESLNKVRLSGTEPTPPPPGKKLKKQAGLVCHYCAHKENVPPQCPRCGFKKIIQGGFGTQRLAKELQEIFPWARILRWDRDSAAKRGEPEKILKAFEEGEGDILIGTVMVAHGFNFPKVTLVGVMDADLNLHVPDFRAAERTFQTITQVAGRAGRAMVAGEVIVQTRNKDHYSIRHAEKMDYKGFIGEELKFRKDMNYPPFSRLIELSTQSANLKKAEKDMSELLGEISRWKEGEPAAGSSLRPDQKEGDFSSVEILGPVFSRRTAKKGMKRLVAFLKIPKPIFPEFLTYFRETVSAKPQSFLINVDPQ